VFQRMKAEGKGSTSPLAESFGQWRNLKVVLIALFGAAAGQGVVWYTGQFYALFFLEKMAKVDSPTANILVATALILATPFFVFFGWLSDKIGRKQIILSGCLIAALTYFPLFGALMHAANPALADAQQKSPVTVYSDPAQCSLQFNPTGTARFTSTCDVAKEFLAKAEADRFKAEMGAALKAAGYPDKADPGSMNKPLIVGILFLMVFYVTMVYGPIAALLVELFPARIRYTSMSLPYHIGNGWFGGFLPATSFAIVAATGDIYNGLWYPIIVAVMTFVIGLLLVRDTRDGGAYHS